MSASIFDRSALKIKPLSQRVHDLSIDAVQNLKSPATVEHLEEWQSVAAMITRAKKKGG